MNYEVRSGSSLYMCGHGEYLLRRTWRPGERSFLGWPVQVGELLVWLNEQPPFAPDDPDDVTLVDEYRFELSRSHRCGHRDLWLYRAHQPGHALFCEESLDAASRFVDWLNRDRPSETTPDR